MKVLGGWTRWRRVVGIGRVISGHVSAHPLALVMAYTGRQTYSVLPQLIKLSLSPILAVAAREGGMGKLIRSRLILRVAARGSSPSPKLDGVVGTATLIPSGVYSLECDLNGSSSSPSAKIWDDTQLLLDGPDDRLLLLDPPLAVTNLEKNPRRGEDVIEWCEEALSRGGRKKS